MKRFFFHPLSLAILTIMSIIFSISLHQSAQKTKISSQNLDDTQREVEKIELEVKELESALNTAQQPLSQEKIIRNELLMQKPGEYVVQIPDQLIQEITTKTQPKSLTPWQEWQVVLF